MMLPTAYEFRIRTEPARPLPGTGAPIRQPIDLYRFWEAAVPTAPWYQPFRECLIVVMLNSKDYPVGFNLVSVGTLTAALAHPREILMPAIVTAGTFAFALAHNHPSGKTNPSAADFSLTRQVKECCDLFNIRLTDHLIVADRPGTGACSVGECTAEGDLFYSFRENGHL